MVVVEYRLAIDLHPSGHMRNFRLVRFWDTRPDLVTQEALRGWLVEREWRFELPDAQIAPDLQRLASLLGVTRDYARRLFNRSGAGRSKMDLAPPDPTQTVLRLTLDRKIEVGERWADGWPDLLRMDQLRW